MLNIIFQKAKAKDPNNVIVDCRKFFSYEKKKEWFEDPFVQNIIGYVDKTKVISGMVLEDEYGNIIPPEYLSTGAKTAICIYEFPNFIFNLTQMGDNAFAFITILSQYRDITALTYRRLPYYQLIDTVFYKDYELTDISNPDTFDDLYDEWLEEIYND